MANTITSTLHPKDPQYQEKRQRQLTELWKMRPHEIKSTFEHMALQPVSKEDRDEQRELTKRVLGEMCAIPGLEEQLTQKSILQSTGGGQVLIRQDLEVPLIALYVTAFPGWQRIQHGQANGLVHAYNTMSAPDGNALGSTAIGELGTVGYNQTTLNRATASIAVLATGRGVSFLEQAAVKAGGAGYNPLATELGNAMVVLARDVQYFMFQGNSTTSSGAGLTTELGAYNANGFDGCRQILGAQGAYSGNNSIQFDAGTLTLTQGIKYVASKGANNGGNPDLAFPGMNAKEAIDTENENKKIYTDNTVEVVAGIKVNQISYANGMIDLLPIPGNTIGTYTRASDSATVEDIPVLDSSKCWIRWLYADNFTVLEIPSGVDSQLSSRYIAFGLFGFELNAPLFMGKVRRVAS